MYEASHELDKRGRRPPATAVHPPPGQRPPIGQMPPNGANSGFPGFYPRDRPRQHGPPPHVGQPKAPPVNGFNPYSGPPYAGPPPGFMPGPMLPVQPLPQQYNRAYPPPPGPYGPPPAGFPYQSLPPTSALTQNRPAHLPPRPPGPLPPPGTGRSGRQRDHRQAPGQPNPNAGGGLNYG